MKAQEREELLQSLKVRFEKNMHRHEGVAWADVHARLERNSDALRSLREMEATGGEPDVVGQDKETGHYTFFDCSAESPAGRRSLCYDREALDSRKEHKPQNSAVEMAARDGYRPSDRGAIPGAAETRRVRSQDFQLDQDTVRHPQTRRSPLL